MSNIDTTIPVSEVNVDGVTMTLIGGSSGENKLAQIVDRSIMELTAEDLQGATTIGSYAFYYCTSLESITIPESVTSIGKYAFMDCDSLRSITIPDSVTLIASYAIRDCNVLESVEIGKGVESISTQAFYGCSNLKTVTIKATTPSTLGASAIPSTITTIYIPTGTLDAYSTATNWSSFADKFVEKDM